MQAVFLIKSPLQYLNALEACSFFSVQPEESLLLIIADRKSSPQLLRLARHNHVWQGVKLLAEVPLLPMQDPLYSVRRSLLRNSAFFSLKLSRIASRLGKVDYLFIGDLANPLSRHFAHQLDCNTTIVLDDGTATLVRATERAAGRLHRRLKLVKRLRLGLKRKVLGLHDKEIPALTFFTLYQNLQAGPNDLVAINDFSCLRQGMLSVAREKKIYFLGGPLIEAGFLSEAVYLELLQQVAAYYHPERVVYVAHRREDPQRLEKISGLTGWSTQVFDYPIEYQLAQIGPLPEQLTSFFSSALETCQQIFGDSLRVCAFRIPQKILTAMPPEKQQVIQRIYAHMETMMPVIDLAEQQS